MRTTQDMSHASKIKGKWAQIQELHKDILLHFKEWVHTGLKINVWEGYKMHDLHVLCK